MEENKTRPMLTPEELAMLRAVLHSNLKHRQIDWKADDQHIAEVIEALRVCGYVIMPRGVLEAIRKVLDAYEYPLPIVPFLPGLKVEKPKSDE